MRARDIMSADPIVVTRDTLMRDAAELMKKYDIGALPVVATRVVPKLVGMITDRDLVTRCMAAGHTGLCRVGEHMTATPDSVLADADVATVASMMGQEHVRRLPVTDGDRCVVGMVSLTDVARALGPTDPARFAELVVTLTDQKRARPSKPTPRFFNPEEAEGEGEAAFGAGLAVV